MTKYAVVMLAALGLTTAVGAHGHDSLVRFEGGIGVIPAANGAGPANADGTLPNVS
jgi:hypothetical protein